MAKRNQYNRSTLPNDMSVVLYNAAAAQTGPTANFTVNADASVLVYLPASSSFTGTIDVSSMRTGQKLDLILPTDKGFLLSCSAGGGKILSGGGFVNASVLAGLTSYSCYKFDSVDIGPGGSATNVLVLHSSASYTGFA